MPTAAERLTICQVTSHPWDERHEINDHVARLACDLEGRGHRVVVAAPAGRRGGTREARRLIESARERPAALFEARRWRGERAGGASGPAVLPMGPGLPMPRGPRPRAAPVPLDASRSFEALLGGIPFDVVHVHDPFAPSIASLGLRHSRSLNVGSFHEPSERVLSTQVARPLVEIFFGRLDARTVSSRRTAELMQRFFPGSYELLEPGAAAAQPLWPRSRDDGGEPPFRIAYCATEERGALRLFLRALRRLPAGSEWEAAVWLPDGGDLRLGRALRERVRVVGPREAAPEELVAGADAVCVASGGSRLAPALVRAALAAGTVPVASHLPLYEELVRDGELGLLFPPGDTLTLAGQLARRPM